MWHIAVAIGALLLQVQAPQAPPPAVPLWGRFETTFTSTREYGNALYDVTRFAVRFTPPSGRSKTVNAFWDGGRTWKVRFMPDEPGTWSFVTDTSRTDDAGIHGVRGELRVGRGSARADLFRRGALRHPAGSYHLAHADGTPFFWVACTAWNGALKSTEEEWDAYLDDRVRNGYSVVQFVTTQWRGAAGDEHGDVAFEGTGRISIRPTFFQRLDRRIDRLNERGLVAAPVVLWALQRGINRELSPGYHLPDPEAILLARYIVARYGAHHVVWLLGGDGLYNGEYEQRWKNIGRGVFGQGDFQGVAGIHSMGKSWIGAEYANESWLEVLGYQSGHSADASTVNWITKGPVSRDWSRLPPRVLINMEPAYEASASGATTIAARDVRNASYWSLLAAPAAGITYGGNAIWPWSRAAGEPLFGHPPRRAATSWRDALRLPGSVQIGYLAKVFRRIEWWTLRPAQDVLLEQPGERDPQRYVAAAKSDDGALLVVYVPTPGSVRLANPFGHRFEAEWFDPVASVSRPGGSLGPADVLEIASPFQEDAVLILRRR